MFEKTKIWISEHKKGLIIAGGVVIGVVVGGVVIYFNKGKIVEIVSKSNFMKKKVVKTASKAVALSAPVVTETIEVISEEELATICETAEKQIITRCPHEVRGFIRNLGTRFPSQSKIAEAAQYGVTLGEHQTWVSSYSTGVKLAV